MYDNGVKKIEGISGLPKSTASIPNASQSVSSSNGNIVEAKVTQQVQNKSQSNQNNENVIDDLQKKLDKMKVIFNKDAKFEIDKEADIVVVKIIDKDSKEVVRQIPSEVAVKLAKALNEVEGVLFDEQA